MIESQDEFTHNFHMNNQQFEELYQILRHRLQPKKDTRPDARTLDTYLLLCVLFMCEPVLLHVFAWFMKQNVCSYEIIFWWVDVNQFYKIKYHIIYFFFIVENIFSSQIIIFFNNNFKSNRINFSKSRERSRKQFSSNYLRVFATDFFVETQDFSP